MLLNYLAAQPGLEPGKADPNSAVLPITPPGNVFNVEFKYLLQALTAILQGLKQSYLSVSFPYNTFKKSCRKLS